MIQSIKKYLRETRYCIGIIEGYKLFEPVNYNNIHWIDLNGYLDGWFADPFIFDVDDKNVTILAEEWYYPINHGRLSKLTIDRKSFKLLNVKPILQLETHLSFPYFVKEDNVVFICPENQESKSVKIYRYDEVKECLTNPVTLIDKPLMDVQIWRKDGVYYLSGVEYITGEQIDTKTLQIYTSENLFGPYTQSQIIASDFCDKRGAGIVIEHDGKDIRPSQCCENNEYGTAVIFNEVSYNGLQFSEKEFARITRNKRRHNGLVLHTFNQCGNLTAIDSWDYTHMYVGRFVEFLRKKFRKYIHS